MKTSIARAILTSGFLLAIAGPTLGQTSVGTSSGAQAIAISGLGAGDGTGGGRTTTTVRAAPSVAPPSFYGANPCSNSASGGGSGIGFGLAIGAQWTERECRDQEWFRFFMMAQEPGVAWAHICANVERMHAALRMAGRQCPNDNTPIPGVAQVAARDVSAAIAVAQAPRPALPALPPLPAYCSVPGIANAECHR